MSEENLYRDLAPGQREKPLPGQFGHVVAKTIDKTAIQHTKAVVSVSKSRPKEPALVKPVWVDELGERGGGTGDEGVLNETRSHHTPEPKANTARSSSSAGVPAAAAPVVAAAVSSKKRKALAALPANTSLGLATQTARKQKRTKKG